MADIFHSPQASQLLKNKEQLEAMMHSAEARQLMALLQSRSGGTLDAAAQAAAKGDPAQLMGILQQVMATPDGARAVEQVSRKIPK